jgi:hypothetical protein
MHCTRMTYGTVGTRYRPELAADTYVTYVRAPIIFYLSSLLGAACATAASLSLTMVHACMRLTLVHPCCLSRYKQAKVNKKI